MTLQEFKLEAFSALIKSAGTMAAPEQGEARINVCRTLEAGNPCRYAGTVRPVPSLSLDGCTLCGCPFATKPHMKTFLGNPVKCVHPDGNQWADIDKSFEQ